MSRLLSRDLSETKIDDVTTAGDIELIAASAGKRGRLHKMVITAAADVTITFKDGSTALTGAIQLIKGIPYLLPFDGEPWFTTTAATALNLATSADVQVSGRAYWLRF